MKHIWYRAIIFQNAIALLKLKSRSGCIRIYRQRLNLSHVKSCHTYMAVFIIATCLLL